MVVGSNTPETELRLGADLVAAVGKSVRVRDRIAERRVTIHKHIPPTVGPLVADEKRLRQIFYNLLSMRFKSYIFHSQRVN